MLYVYCNDILTWVKGLIVDCIEQDLEPGSPNFQRGFILGKFGERGNARNEVSPGKVGTNGVKDD